MKPLWKMTKKEIQELINTTNDGDLIDEAYDELDRREEDERNRDHTEEDEQDAFQTRYDNWRNEY